MALLDRAEVMFYLTCSSMEINIQAGIQKVNSSVIALQAIAYILNFLLKQLAENDSNCGKD